MFRWLAFALFISSSSFAQPIVWPTPEAEQLYTATRTLLAGGNFRGAITGFQQVINLAPGVMQPYRDLGNAYYLSGAYDKADATLASIIAKGVADEQTYAVAAASQAAQRAPKKARRLLDKGIERYPHSGLLYHDYGKLYDDAADEEAALKKWVEGIRADPSFRVNYYEAARTYYITSKPVWAILYGEIFVNLEPLTPRSGETRKMLLAAYRRFFLTSTDIKDGIRYGNAGSGVDQDNFEQAVTLTLLKLAPVVSDGINTENLTMLRSRFSLAWTQESAVKYPFTLFAFWDDLLRHGHFEAYNEWLFAKAENAQEYEAWQKFHAVALPDLMTYSSAHPLRPAMTDAYNEGSMKGIFPKLSSKR